MADSRIDGNLNVIGNIACRSITLPALTVTNAMVNAAAAIAATKIQKPRLKDYQQNGTASSVTVVLYECRGATATVIDFRAGNIVACIGAATITVDLKKNGSTILSAVITLDNANTARVSEAASFASTALVSGDWLEIVVTATAGGGTLGTGLFVQLEVHEDQP